MVGSEGRGPASFRQFSATELFCNHCRSAQPVRERLLLVLPDGELFEYLCATCGTEVGKRMVESARPLHIAS
jgi:hypothetical protein